MSEVNGAADAAAVAVTPAPNAGAAATADTKAATNGADAPFINKAEFVELAKLTRSLKDQVTALAAGTGRTTAPEPKPQTGDDKYAALEFRVVLAEQASHLSDVQRQTLSKLHRADAPPDAVSWMREQVAALGWARGSTATPPTPPAKAEHVTNTGAPGSSGGPANLADAVKDAEVYKSLSREDRMKAWDAFKATDPSVGRTFAKSLARR